MYLTISLPPELSLNSSTVECRGLSGISGSLACSFNHTSKTIRVQNGFPSAYYSGQAMFSIGNITNPREAIQTSSFKFYSYTSDGYLLDMRE